MSFPEPPSRIDARLYIHRFLGRSRIAAVATSPKNQYPAGHENKQNRIQNIRGFSFLEGRKPGAVVHVVQVNYFVLISFCLLYNSAHFSA